MIRFGSCLAKKMASLMLLQARFSQTAQKNTIYALSTGFNSAISIVRVSGPQAYKVLKLIGPPKHLEEQKKENLLALHKISPKQMTLKSVYSKKYGLIDKCLMVYFQAAKSYSGEDLFEFHLHGSKAIIELLFGQLKDLSFKPAKRGQFTQRAVINGRMNLLQAQAINQLIKSQFQFQRQIAVGNILGKGQKYLIQLKNRLISIKSLIQGFIQFEQSQVGLGLITSAKKTASDTIAQLQNVLQSSERLQKAREGIKISIAGRPNVGKSTLINRLVKRQVSIVSEIPGTTRDLIESSFEANGYRITIVDTAGIRPSECPIQIEGIRRSKASIEQSKICFMLLDISQSIIEETQSTILLKLHSNEQQMMKQSEFLFVINKIDKLATNSQDKDIKIVLKDGKMIDPWCSISAKKEKNIQNLLQKLGFYIDQKYNLYSKDQSQVYFTRDRYLQALKYCIHNLNLLQDEPLADICSYHIDTAIRSISQVLGRIDNEQILDQIFSSFCIGK